LDSGTVPTLTELLEAVGPARLSATTSAGLDRPVGRIALAETLGDVDAVAPDALVVLSRAASAEAATYRFDVAVRRGAERSVVGLAVVGGVEPSRSARAAADRTNIALLRAGRGEDLATLVSSLGALLRGDADVALERASAGLRVLDDARTDGAGVRATLAAAAHAVPGAVLGEPEPGVSAERVVVDGVTEAWLVAREAGPIEALLLRAAAADVAVAMGRARRADEAPVRSRSELLTELLATEPGRDAALLRRARALGLPVDAWHAVVVVRTDDADAEDAVHAEEVRRAVERVALASARAVSGTWHVARSEGATVLVRTTDAEPLARDDAARTAAAAVLGAIEDRFAGVGARAGVGGSHLGPAGLRASTAEARAAAATAPKGGPAAVFDASGLRAMLAEWYATDSARRSVSSLLEPLERLGGRRADEAIRTLQVFLDERGSVTRTARRLHLHRNAVAYRIARIREAVPFDPDDPDARLALQLACRARALT
jgi:sugar diacid utilization regulator